jgi:hypothetical protein
LRIENRSEEKEHCKHFFASFSLFGISVFCGWILANIISVGVIKLDWWRPDGSGGFLSIFFGDFGFLDGRISKNFLRKIGAKI